MIVAFAVRLTVALKEVARSNRFFAMSAHEVLGMPKPSESRYYLSNYWLSASGTMSLWDGHDTLSGHVVVQLLHHFL